MGSHRVEQVSSTVTEELTKALLRVYEAPPGVMVTIEEVRMYPDLQTAKVYVSVFPVAQAEGVVESISGIRHVLQQEIAKRLVLKKLPKLQFVADTREETADRINRLLDDPEA